MSNDSCFLEELQWLRLLRGLADEDAIFSDRGQLGIDLVCILIRMPGLAKRATAAVMCEDEQPLSHTDLSQLATDINQLRLDICAWRIAFDAALECNQNASLDASLQDRKHEMMITSMLLSLIILRLLEAVSPPSASSTPQEMYLQHIERRKLEDEAQKFVQQVEQLQLIVSDQHYRARFFLAQKKGIARATAQTELAWKELGGMRRVLNKPAFVSWCDAFGRTYKP